MGIDYGEKTIGIAISDSLGWIAQGRLLKKEKKSKKVLNKSFVDQYNVEKIVLGLPKNMNNTLGFRAEKTLKFKEKLEKLFLFL